DGSKLAFVSDRTDHSLIAIYDSKTRKVHYLAPSVDRDASPTWSNDGKRIAFIRRPGLPFGQQAHDGPGGLGEPPGPARGLGRGGNSAATAKWSQSPGMLRASFEGGYTLSFWVADVATGEGKEVWHNAPQDRVFPN